MGVEMGYYSKDKLLNVRCVIIQYYVVFFPH